VQFSPFAAALNKFDLSNIEIHYLSTSVSRTWSQEAVVDWLMDSDIHIILAHIHQGLKWNIPVWLNLLDRLSYHYGWPAHENLYCPIFLQDKYIYLSALPDLTNDTFAYRLNSISKYKYFKIIKSGETNLFDWMRKYDFGNGFVVKLPFTTNCQSIRFCTTYEKVFDAINMFNCKEFNGGDDIPYAIIQPRLRNRREEKITLHNGKARTRFTKNTNGKVFLDQKNLFNFAENALLKLKEVVPSTITDGLTRVDIMITDYGKIIVNEFESLEATYYSSKTCSNEEVSTQQFLELYWVKNLNELFKYYQ
jgi:hypothetical protein